MRQCGCVSVGHFLLDGRSAVSIKMLCCSSLVWVSHNEVHCELGVEGLFGSDELWLSIGESTVSRRGLFSVGAMPLVLSSVAGKQPGFRDAVGSLARFSTPTGIVTHGSSIYVADMQVCCM